MANTQRTPSPFQGLIAGTVSGMAAIAVCHPFDVIRTRLQLNPTLSFKVAASQGGVVGLYSGFKTPFIAQGVYKAIIFSTNTASIKYLFDGKRSQSAVLASGVLAGTVNSLVVAPVEMIRTAQILQNSKPTYSSSSSVLTTIKEIQNRNGLFSLWRAAFPTIMRDGPGMGLYMLAFEQGKSWLSSLSVFHGMNGSVSIGVKMLSGAFSGVVFWTWALPIDTVKAIIESRIQGSGVVATETSWKAIIQRSVKSLPIAYLRGIPSAAVTLTTYDYVIDFLLKH